mmetsp:Transcript_13839/g.21218  ORF Transcript_13839/g.21218 Transcript_13839/m.21218 type:complete len:83 (+) Transcript_13839:826-1074(+)
MNTSNASMTPVEMHLICQTTKMRYCLCSRKSGKVMMKKKAIAAVTDLNSVTQCLQIENSVHFVDGLDCFKLDFAKGNFVVNI